jgi:hypothetical protein
MDACKIMTKDTTMPTSVMMAVRDRRKNFKSNEASIFYTNVFVFSIPSTQPYILKSIRLPKPLRKRANRMSGAIFGRLFRYYRIWIGYSMSMDRLRKVLPRRWVIYVGNALRRNKI